MGWSGCYRGRLGPEGCGSDDPLKAATTRLVVAPTGLMLLLLDIWVVGLVGHDLPLMQQGRLMGENE